MSESYSKDVVFIPCVGAGLADYSELQRSLDAKGMRLHGINLDWEDRTLGIKDLAEATKQQVEALDIPDEAVLLGHSIGAVVAAMEAARRSYGRLVLCSTAPVGEIRRVLDLILIGQPPLPEDEYKSVQQLAHLDPNVIFGNEDLPQGEESVRVLVGQNEIGDGAMIRQATEAALLLGTSVQILPRAKHFIDHYPNYVEAATAATT